jgi:hypothetical protein
MFGSEGDEQLRLEVWVFRPQVDIHGYFYGASGWDQFGNGARNRAGTARLCPLNAQRMAILVRDNKRVVQNLPIPPVIEIERLV